MSAWNHPIAQTRGIAYLAGLLRETYTGNYLPTARMVVGRWFAGKEGKREGLRPTQAPSGHAAQPLHMGGLGRLELHHAQRLLVVQEHGRIDEIL
jgi:hypothetical protein